MVFSSLKCALIMAIRCSGICHMNFGKAFTTWERGKYHRDPISEAIPVR
jgi:hypothetical protein